MRNEFLKTLWMLRFEKLRQGEEAAARKYQEVLHECLPEFGTNHEIVQLLHQLVKEEQGHAKMVQELIRLCQRNHPEVHALSVELNNL